MPDQRSPDGVRGERAQAWLVNIGNDDGDDDDEEEEEEEEEEWSIIIPLGAISRRNLGVQILQTKLINSVCRPKSTWPILHCPGSPVMRGLVQVRPTTLLSTAGSQQLSVADCGCVIWRLLERSRRCFAVRLVFSWGTLYLALWKVDGHCSDVFPCEAEVLTHGCITWS